MPGRWPIALYVIASFAAAFLIFLVQPMVGKRILPWFGGVPAVWTLCLAFFQTTLFLGYAYAHLLIRFAASRLQLGIHAVAVVAAFLSLPVLPSLTEETLAGNSPAAQVLWVLTASVALPFLVLAATGPLVQAWFARAHPGRSPYPLYAVSNFGSLLALFSYPFLIEPNLSLSRTGTSWSFGFVLASALVLACVAPVARWGGGAGVPGPGEADGGEPVGARSIGLWVLLPGCAVVLLMGVTNKLCLDVASVPFLWILPLATYLVTFILSFASERVYRRTPYVLLAVVSFFLTDPGGFWPRAFNEFMGLEAVVTSGTMGVRPILAFGTCLLFSTCMILHGELYRLRPPARSLTNFYLCISAGGALGGLLVGIVAPLVLGGYYELHVGLALCVVLFLCACAVDRKSGIGSSSPRWRWWGFAPIALGVVILRAWMAAQPLPMQIYQERSFFGILRVIDTTGNANGQKQLYNGTTLHGLQFTEERFSNIPTSYFGRATGVGLALDAGGDEGGRRIGVVGLGVGTLAAYVGPRDVFRFYEIDPAVARVAREEFTFLSAAPGRVDVVLGDARLSIAEEQEGGKSQEFDFLIVDAFTSDAIPVHLLTREAFVHYADALAHDGVLAVHVSNRHFSLAGLVARMGHEVGLSNLVVVTKVARRLQSQAARWVLLVRDRDRLVDLKTRVLDLHRDTGLAPSALRISTLELDELGDVPVWTDDYSDLFSLLLPAT